MRLPTISQYLRSVGEPHGLFRTLGEPVAERDCYRRVKMCAGRSAVVFRVLMADGTHKALKCYLKAPQYARQVYDYLSARSADCPALAQADYLQKELYVFDHDNRGTYHDVVLADWVEGETLENVLRRAAADRDTDTIGRLAAAFDRLALGLLDEEWAHGDLKPENIIVRSSPQLEMTLIDYDAAFVPSLAGRQTCEIGTKSYQHPGRTGALFDKRIDDYPIAMISVSLHALALQPELYGMHNRGDNIILSPQEVLDGRSPLHGHLLRLWETTGDRRLHALCAALGKPLLRFPPVGPLMRQVQTAAGTLHPFQQGGKWGFADEQGRAIIAPHYDEVMDFSDGLAPVRLGRSWHFIDRSGRVAVNCSAYTRVKPFHEGLAAVESGGLWGYIDLAGSVAIQPKFEIACNLCEGLAAVRVSKKYGYIDRRGEWAVRPRFDMAGSFHGGAALVRTRGKVIRLDKESLQIDENPF